MSRCIDASGHWRKGCQDPITGQRGFRCPECGIERANRSEFCPACGEEPPPPPPLVPLCMYRGGLMEPPNWVECRHPDRPLGRKVCSCNGCGPSCRGYTLVPPLDYRISLCIPHLDTPEQLELGIALWRQQTVRPYLIVVDTGSPRDVCRRLELLRGPDCEVHYLAPVKRRHPSACVAHALDLAQLVCPTTYLLHTHTDVFPRRDDFLAWMLSQASPDDPVIGWRMSPRIHGPWEECVSHTATILHIPFCRQNCLNWNLETYLDETGWTAPWHGGWPDTESGFHWSMKRAGLSPKLLGNEDNHCRNQTEWWDHTRSFTCARGSGDGPRAAADMAVGMTEARSRLHGGRTGQVPSPL